MQFLRAGAKTLCSFETGYRSWKRCATQNRSFSAA